MRHHDFDDTEWSIDPDQVTVPESVDHREFTDTLAQFAALALGPSQRVIRNLAWYPTPADNAMAPDIMVLPAAAVPDGTTSYRQIAAGGPAPAIVVEVVSDGNTLSNGLAKLRRYRALGVPAIVIDLDERIADRFETTGFSSSCLDRPIPELAGIRVIDDPEQGLLVEGLDGRRARRLDVASAELAARAEAEAARADRLAAALRALGHDPTTI